MEHLILEDEDGGTAILTTDSPASSYGVPVLQITAEDVDGDFGPADLIGNPDKGVPLITAASIVAGWGKRAATNRRRAAGRAAILRSAAGRASGGMNPVKITVAKTVATTVATRVETGRFQWMRWNVNVSK